MLKLTILIVIVFIYDFIYTDYSDYSSIVILQKPEDFVILNRTYQEFTEIKDNYFKIRYELSFRDENLGLNIEPLNIYGLFCISTSSK